MVYTTSLSRTGTLPILHTQRPPPTQSQGPASLRLRRADLRAAQGGPPAGRGGRRTCGAGPAGAGGRWGGRRGVRGGRRRGGRAGEGGAGGPLGGDRRGGPAPTAPRGPFRFRPGPALRWSSRRHRRRPRHGDRPAPSSRRVPPGSPGPGPAPRPVLSLVCQGCRNHLLISLAFCFYSALHCTAQQSAPERPIRGRGAYGSWPGVGWGGGP